MKIKKKTLYLTAIALVITALGFFPVQHPDEIKYNGSEEKIAKVLEVKREGITQGSFAYAGVIKTVDGDTLIVSCMRAEYRVRLLNVDTPESVKEDVAKQPFSEQATEFTKNLCDLKTVKLVFENDLKDKYGRLLAHVILPDGRYLNGLLVEKGYARAQIIKPNILLKEYFEEIQQKAIIMKAGFWRLPEEKRPFRLENGRYEPVYY